MRSYIADINLTLRCDFRNYWTLVGIMSATDLLDVSWFAFNIQEHGASCCKRAHDGTSLQVSFGSKIWYN